MEKKGYEDKEGKKEEEVQRIGRRQGMNLKIGRRMRKERKRVRERMK